LDFGVSAQSNDFGFWIGSALKGRSLKSDIFLIIPFKKGGLKPFFLVKKRKGTYYCNLNPMDSATRLQTILVDSPVGAVLPAIALLNLPNWWLAGGAVRNTIWRSLRQLQR
jgi:hypothetical protein